MQRPTLRRVISFGRVERTRTPGVVSSVRAVAVGERQVSRNQPRSPGRLLFQVWREYITVVGWHITYCESSLNSPAAGGRRAVRGDARRAGKPWMEQRGSKREDLQFIYYSGFPRSECCLLTRHHYSTTSAVTTAITADPAEFGGPVLTADACGRGLTWDVAVTATHDTRHTHTGRRVASAAPGGLAAGSLWARSSALGAPPSVPSLPSTCHAGQTTRACDAAVWGRGGSPALRDA